MLDLFTGIGIGLILGGFIATEVFSYRADVAHAKWLKQQEEQRKQHCRENNVPYIPPATNY